MDQRQAQWGFISLNILAIGAVSLPFYELYRIYTEVKSGALSISYDRADFFFLLMSVFWVMWLIQHIGLSGNKGWVTKKAQPLLIGWFVGAFIFASIIPVCINYVLNQVGYQLCENQNDYSILKFDTEVTLSLNRREKGCP